MALSRVTTWLAGQTLTASALNGEFDNILDNALSLISPLSGNLDANANRLINLSAGTVGSPSIYFSGDSDTGLYHSAANTVDVAVGGVRALSVSSVTGATAYLAVSHSAVTAADAVTLTATGTAATNIPLILAGQGTAYTQVGGGTTVGGFIIPGLVAGSGVDGLASLTIGTIDLVSGARRVLQGIDAAEATNYLTITSAATGSGPTVSVAGADPNIGLTVDTKGTGPLTLGSADTGGITAATYFVPVAFGGGTGDDPAQHALYRGNVVKAWASFLGDGTSLRGFNINSISRSAAGRYTVTFERAFTATPYAVFGSAQYDTSTASTKSLNVAVDAYNGAMAVGSCQLIVINDFTAGLVDGYAVTVGFLGDQ